MTGNAQLKAFVERVERLEEEIKALNDDKRDIYAEAKGTGYDVRALKIVIGRRRKNPDELSELEALVDTYEAALGTPVATRVRARPAERITEGLTEALAIAKGEQEPAKVHCPHASDDLDIPEFLRRQKVSA